jgi:predicted alpha/beta hydrolase
MVDVARGADHAFLARHAAGIVPSLTMDITIPARDGFVLRGTLYDAGSDRALLIASAMGVRRRYYDAFARFLRERGITVVTFDYRGIGDSRPRSLRGCEAAMRDWGELDIAAAIDFIAREVKPRALYFAGHSAGGQLAGSASNIGRVSKLVLFCAQSGYWRHWRGVRAFGLRSLWMAMPVIARILGYFPGLSSEALPRGVASQWAKWGRHRDYLFSEIDPTPYANLRVPLLAWSFEADRYAPKPAVDWLVRHYDGATVDRKHVDHLPLGHFDVFRRGKGEAIWNETVDWLNSNVPDTSP